MTVHITSGSSGWGNYVLYGTKDKPRDSEKVELIEGDIGLGDRLCESNNYEESYYKILLSFDKKVDRETALAVYEDFKKEFFVGLKADEYHIDTVLHRDTDYDHFHMRIPKQNLVTDTHLQLYMDKIDRPRKQLIQDHLSLKYGFEIAREKDKKIFKEENTKIDIINKWREEHEQKPFDFKTKQGQKEAEQQINTYVADLIKSELITSQDDVKSTLEELGLTVERFGHDEKKDFYYATVSNESGKIRVKGDIYKDEFFKHNAKDRTASIENNRRIEPDRGSIEERAKQVSRELRKANEKRFNKVTKLFKHSRERAEREHSKTIEVGRVESLNASKHNKHSNIDISNDIHNKSDKLKEAPKLIKREDDRGNRRAVSQISSQRAYLRPTEKSLLLQNRLKERANARYYDKIIERARKSRETQQSVIREAERERSSDKATLQRAREQRDSLSERIREYGSKISGAFETIREKALNRINEMKEKLSEAKKRFLDKTDSIDKKTSLSERFKSVDKSIEVSTQENKSDSSYLNKQQELQAPAKKRSYGRSR